MIKPVEKGCFYCVTATGPCTVKTIGYGDQEYLILELEEPGQAIFCAPTWKVEISDDSAILTETFKKAGANGGVGIGSGGSSKLRIKVYQSLEEITDPKKNIIYLIPVDDHFDEYLYVEDSEGEMHFEKIGSYSVEKQVISDINDLKERVQHLEENWTTDEDGNKILITDNIKGTQSDVIYLSSVLTNE